jgi:hypothetical protein
MAHSRERPTCVIPGCDVLVAEAGDTCHGCVRDFGAMLRPTGQPRLTADQIAARDDGVRAAYALQRRVT